MTDKNCGTCFYQDDYDCYETAGECDGFGFGAWQPLDFVKDDGNPFNTQVGGTHYKKTDGCPDVAEWCGLQKVEFLEGNVIKYVFRHERKNGFEDIEKAMQYLRFIAWVKYNKTL